MLLILYSLTERWRILHYRMRRRGGFGSAHVPRRQWFVAVLGLSWVLFAVALDKWAVPRTGVSLSHSGKTDLDAILGAVAGLTGLLAIAVSVSTISVSSVLQRYSPSVAVPLLFDETRDRLLNLIAQTFIVSVSLLLISAVGWSVPVVGSLIAAFLGLVVLLSLTAYIRQRVSFLHPAVLAVELARQMSVWLRIVADGNPGRSVSRALRERFEGNFRLLVEMCVVEVDHKLEEEAGQILLPIARVVRDYLSCRRHIPSKSEWFPYREVPVVGFDHHLSPMFEQLALGTPRRQERYLYWFEDQVEVSLRRLVALAAGSSANTFALALVVSTGKLAVDCVQQQELEMLDRMCGVSTALANNVQSLPSALQAVDTGLSLHHAAEPGLGIDAAARAISSHGLTSRSIRRANFATIVKRKLEELENKVRRERTVVGRHVSPSQALVQQVVAELTELEGECKEQIRRQAIGIIETLATAAVSAGASEAVFAAVSGLALLAELHLSNGDAANAAEVANRIPPLWKVDSLEAVSEPTRSLTLDRLRVLVVKAITAHTPGVAATILPEVIRSLFRCNDMETISALCGLSYLRSELSQDQKYMDWVEEGFELANIDVSKFAQVAIGGKARRTIMSPRAGIQYHDYVRAFAREIDALPRKQIRHGGSVVIDENPDHPSRFIESMGFQSMLLSLDRCVLACLRQYLPESVLEEDE